MSYLLGQYAQWTSAYPIAACVTTIFIQLLLIVGTIQLISQYTSRRDVALTSRLWRFATVLAIAILPLNLASYYWGYPISATSGIVAAIAESPQITSAQSFSDIEVTDLDVVTHETSKLHPISPDQSLAKSSTPLSPIDIEPNSQVVQEQASKPLLWQGLLALYCFGVFWFLARIAYSFYLLQRRASATAEVAPSFIRHAEECARQLSVPRLPAIRACSSVQSPYIFGSFWPMLVVPQAIDAWSDEERAAVLAHELAHVKRYDFAWSLLANVVNAIYWPHPASWWLHRRMLDTRELAADEFACSASIDRRSYATGLVQVIERLSKSGSKLKRESSLAITMSTYDDVYQRIENVLRTKSSIGQVFRWSVRFCALATILIVAATSIKLRVIEAQETTQKPVGDVSANSEHNRLDPNSIVNRMTVEYTNEPPSAGDNDLITLVARSEIKDNRAAKDSIEFNYKGKVVGPDNKPIAGATVVLFEHMYATRVASLDANRLGLQDKPFAKLKDVVAKVTTASDGSYEIRGAKSYSLKGWPPEMWQGSIIATHPEHGLGWYTLRFNDRDKIDREPIILETTIDVSGTYLTPDGKPLPNAVVYVRGFRRNSKNDQTAGVHLAFSQMEPMVLTNAEGKFTFSGIPKACIASVYFKHADWGQNWAPCKSTQFEESRYSSFPSENAYANPMTVVAEPDFVFQGRISDAQNQPVFGAILRVDASIGIAESDQSGQFRLALPLQYVRDATKRQSTNPVMHIRPTRGLGYLPLDTPLDGIDPSKPIFEKDIELKKGVLVTGQLVDESGKPTTFINITAVTDSGEISQAGTDAEGKFSLYVAPERIRLFFVSFKGGYKLPTYNNVSPFTHRSSNSAPPTDVPEHWKTLAIDAAGKDSIAIPPITVERVPPIEITVTASDGIPAKNVMVMIEDYTRDTSPSASKRSDALAYLANPMTAEFPTDELGQVSITYPGFLSERAVAITKYTSPSGVNYTVKTPLTELQDNKLTVRLETDNNLRGRVLLNGKPIAGASVALQENEPLLDAQGKSTHSGVTRTILTATTNNDGYYFAAIPPSGKQYYVSLESLPGHNPPRSSDRLSYGVVKRGDGKFYTNDIKAYIYDGEISGVLVDEDGMPIQRATLYISLPQFANEIWGYQPLTTDAEGRFSMKHIPPGKLKLSVSAVGEKQIRQAVQEVSAGDQNIKLQLDSGTVLQLISPPNVR